MPEFQAYVTATEKEHGVNNNLNQYVKKANETQADLLNVALFGETAKQWKNNNPSKKGNVRDEANLNQLLVLANMESYNTILIEQGKSQSESSE